LRLPGVQMAQMARIVARIGAAIRRERRRQGLTQKELGIRTGLRRATISRLESGAPAVQLLTLVEIMSALRLDLKLTQRQEFNRSELERPF